MNPNEAQGNDKKRRLHSLLRHLVGIGSHPLNDLDNAKDNSPPIGKVGVGLPPASEGTVQEGLLGDLRSRLGLRARDRGRRRPLDGSGFDGGRHGRRRGVGSPTGRSAVILAAHGLGGGLPPALRRLLLLLLLLLKKLLLLRLHHLHLLHPLGEDGLVLAGRIAGLLGLCHLRHEELLLLLELGQLHGHLRVLRAHVAATAAGLSLLLLLLLHHHIVVLLLRRHVGAHSALSLHHIPKRVGLGTSRSGAAGSGAPGPAAPASAGLASSLLLLHLLHHHVQLRRRGRVVATGRGAAPAVVGVAAAAAGVSAPATLLLLLLLDLPLKLGDEVLLLEEELGASAAAAAAAAPSGLLLLLLRIGTAPTPALAGLVERTLMLTVLLLLLGGLLEGIGQGRRRLLLLLLSAAPSLLLLLSSLVAAATATLPVALLLHLGQHLLLDLRLLGRGEGGRHRRRLGMPLAAPLLLTSASALALTLILLGLEGVLVELGLSGVLLMPSVGRRRGGGLLLVVGRTALTLTLLLPLLVALLLVALLLLLHKEGGVHPPHHGHVHAVAVGTAPGGEGPSLVVAADAVILLLEMIHLVHLLLELGGLVGRHTAPARTSAGAVAPARTTALSLVLHHVVEIGHPAHVHVVHAHAAAALLVHHHHLLHVVAVVVVIIARR